MKKTKLVYGWGINDYEGKISSNGKKIKSYKTWTSMIRRCFSEEYLKDNPSYKGVEISKEWLSFKKFKAWFDKNYPYHLEEQGVRLELDKDLLREGNKRIYSPETCIFLPAKANSFLTNKQSTNTSGYIGVSWNKKTRKWTSQIKNFDNNKSIYLGSFKDIKNASEAYIKAREIQSLKVKEYLRDLEYDERVIEKIK